jgi:lysophospholipid acyltransferase (LPLAT)-like uncharacterized protein
VSGAPVEREPAWVGPASLAGALLFHLLGRSWRITRVGMDAWSTRAAAGERCIFAFWHARMLPLIYTHRDRRVAALVSRSRDGELISRIVERLGYVTARGSSSRGAQEGTLEMLNWADRGHSLTLSPDGPRGPAERVKPGLVFLASRTGLPVLPVGMAARPVRVLRSWDGFRVPPPFARVWVGYGEPIVVPAGLDAAGEERWRVRLEEAITAVTRALDVLAAGGA